MTNLLSATDWLVADDDGSGGGDRCASGVLCALLRGTSFAVAARALQHNGAAVRVVLVRRYIGPICRQI